MTHLRYQRPVISCFGRYDNTMSIDKFKHSKQKRHNVLICKTCFRYSLFIFTRRICLQVSDFYIKLVTIGVKNKILKGYNGYCEEKLFGM